MPINFNAGADAVRANPAAVDMGDDFFGVKHMESARSKLQRFSSAWDVGSQLTCFYPFRLVPSRDDPDQSVWVPCMSAVWGHRVNEAKLLHRSFLRSRCTMTPNGEVEGSGDLAYQFSRIAFLLVRAKKEAELADLASRDWGPLGQAGYQTARQAVEDKYDPNKMTSVKPLLGRLTMQCNTIVFAVAMNPNTSTPELQPDDSSKTKTGMFSQTLSQERKDKLYNLANSVMYGVNAQNPDQEFKRGDVAFLEVTYNFTSARMEKNEAGRAEPQGIAAAVSILTRFPDIKPKVQERLKQVPTNPDDIRSKLYAMDPMRDEDLLKALQQYTFQTATDWHALNDEDKGRLLDAANLIDYLRIVPSDPALQEEFAKRLGHPIGMGTTEEAPTIEGLVGSDANFDVSKQSEAVANALKEAEQGAIPIENDEAAAPTDASELSSLAETVEV